MFSVHAMVGGGQSTAARSAQVEVILELSRDVFFSDLGCFFPHHSVFKYSGAKKYSTAHYRHKVV